MLAIADARWAEGKASAILAIFAARGIEVSGTARAQFESCKDVVTLDRWIAQAVSAASADELTSPTHTRRS